MNVNLARRRHFKGTAGATAYPDPAALAQGGNTATATASALYNRTCVCVHGIIITTTVAGTYTAADHGGTAIPGLGLIIVAGNLPGYYSLGDVDYEVPLTATGGANVGLTIPALANASLVYSIKA